MIKIIRQGKLPEETEYTGTCNKCKTEVEFLEKDGTKQSDIHGDTYIYCKCPLCNNTINGHVKKC